MKLRIGLIGLGDAWQTRHRPALRMLQDRFDVRAVYNTISKLADKCAADFEAEPVGGYRELVSRGDIDAVMVLQHSWHGWLPVIAACEAGKAVYWAGALKFADNEVDIRQVIETSGVAFMTEFTRRFAPATLRLKELIATKLGQPNLIFCHRRMTPNESGAAHNNLKNTPDQELVELIDWCRYVVDREPVSVTSMTGPATNYQSLSLHFPKSGELPAVTSQISCGNYIPDNWHEASSFRPPAAMQICCERGVAFIDLPSSLVWFDDAGRHMEALETESPVGEQLLTHFHRAVTSLVRNLGDLNDAYRAAKILDAAQISAEEGRRIEI